MFLPLSRLPTSQGQVRVFFICFPSVELRAWNLAVIGECVLTGDVETEKEHLLIRPLQVWLGIGASFQEEHLARQSSRLARPVRQPALPCLVLARK